MASTIKLKRSSVAGNAPTTSNITTGELALNTADGILYSTDGSSVFEIGANLTTLTVENQVTLTGLISANGSIGIAGQTLHTDASGKVYWASAGGGSGSSYPNSTFTTAPGSTDNFDMSYNVQQTIQETPFEASGTDAFGVNLGSVFSFMDPVGTTESVDYGDSEAYVGA